MDYIAQEASSLANLAAAGGRPFLAYLLRMAAEEASHQAQRKR